MDQDLIITLVYDKKVVVTPPLNASYKHQSAHILGIINLNYSEYELDLYDNGKQTLRTSYK